MTWNVTGQAAAVQLRLRVGFGLQSMAAMQRSLKRNCPE